MGTYRLTVHSCVIFQLIANLIIVIPGTQLNIYVLSTLVMCSWLATADDIWNRPPANMILQGEAYCVLHVIDIIIGGEVSTVYINFSSKHMSQHTYQTHIHTHITHITHITHTLLADLL